VGANQPFKGLEPIAGYNTEYMLNGQYNAGPEIVSLAAKHQHHLAGIKYCFVLATC